MTVNEETTRPFQAGDFEETWPNFVPQWILSSQYFVSGIHCFARAIENGDLAQQCVFSDVTTLKLENGKLSQVTMRSPMVRMTIGAAPWGHPLYKI